MMNVKHFTLLGFGFSLFLATCPIQAQADSIVRVGACKVGYKPSNLVVQGDYLYLADDELFKIIDISTPSNPQIISALDDPATDRVKNVFVKDTLAYTRRNEVLAIVNIANVDSPVVIGQMGGLPGGGCAFDRNGLFVSDTICFWAGDIAGVWICNVADPTNPFLIDSFSTTHSMNLTVRDSILFIADYDSLLIVNAKNPMNLKRLSAVPMPERAYDVCVKGNYAYVACVSYFGDDGRLKIVDISNLQNPEVVGEIIGIRGDPVAVYLENDYAYIAAADYTGPPSGIPGGVRIVNISNPDSGQLAVSYDTPGSPQDVYVVGDLIFVANPTPDANNDNDSVRILKHIHTGVEEEFRVEKLELRVWPNPFEKQANIRFNISSPTNGKIEIYDKVSRKVRILYNGLLFPARYRFYWNRRDKYGKEVTNGEYFIVVSVGDKVKETKKVIYLK